ncbi:MULTISPECIES: TnsD family Tn7-like transposition protein [unclassified Idiomarina]|jgi:hypothetical protein|uniref:TnsD family Tn7-like transposition protein n=3 Tax=Idiomarina TaxID=135575 RepID=UPI000C8E70B1|nr:MULTISPECIES: TnsD family Tn7-like transposition protein [unclassified Idiomarina]MAD53812.1 transposase [Idiomarinaceae bacterium]|tara:strand:- start:2780 stop:4288 length:1509 start_codon:yes stop_codon:yes gene_type:complete
MLGFPIPYPNELIYSTIARYGVHSGLTSPKEILQEVFGSKTIIATSDLHGHLGKIAGLYPLEINIQPEDLLYRHTLFPLYAPFIGEQRRCQLMKQLIADKKNSVHVMSGFAASRVTQPNYLRYCPKCIEQQWNELGECFWRRDWQVAGIDSCPLHGKLKMSSVRRMTYKRHVYTPASRTLCPLVHQESMDKYSRILEPSIAATLGLPEQSVPSIFQWGLFYKAMACDFGLNRGQQVEHELVAERVIKFWTADWLNHSGLNVSESETCWLRTLFRKHRKSFSYLEHLIVLHAFLGDKLTLNDVIGDVRRQQPRSSLVRISSVFVDKLVVLRKRFAWLKAIKNRGVKRARAEGFAGLYTWLYRYDNSWLLGLNAKLKHREPSLAKRVNWDSQDLTTVKMLISIRNQVEPILEGPRRSKNWYLSQLDNKSKLEKNLRKLPKCSLFLHMYSETISDFQIRRMTRVAAKRTQEDEQLKRWDILRSAGLSEERLTQGAREFLSEVLEL